MCDFGVHRFDYWTFSNIHVPFDNWSLYDADAKCPVAVVLMGLERWLQADPSKLELPILTALSFTGPASREGALLPSLSWGPQVELMRANESATLAEAPLSIAGSGSAEGLEACFSRCNRQGMF